MGSCEAEVKRDSMGKRLVQGGINENGDMVNGNGGKLIKNILTFAALENNAPGLDENSRRVGGKNK